jgi:hypothetical protein
VGGYETGGTVGSFDVSGPYAYVGGLRPNLRIFDISDPSQPTQIAEVRVEELGGGVSIDGQIAYLRTAHALYLIGISDPGAPEVLATFETPEAPAGVTISGQYAFVALHWGGLLVLDVSDPTAPLQVGSYNGGGQLSSVCISGSVAFLLGGARVQVLDISDPTAPSWIGSFSYPHQGFSHAMTVRGHLAYLANGSAGLSIIDISNPVAPIWVGRYDTGWWSTYDVDILGRYAYIALHVGGVEIVDISDPTAPVPVGRHDTFARAYRVSASGSYAFVADGEGGLLIFRVTMRGDLNCDGVTNGADIDPFFLALADLAAYAVSFPTCNRMNADVNADGSVNGADIDPFFECLGSGGCP